MTLISLLKTITDHPLNKDDKFAAILRLVKWQFNTKLNPYPIVYSFTDRCKLVIGKGMTGATQNLYCGLHEYSDMLFLLHFLRKQDLFADVGANVGSYTILASAHIGAETISCEPVPATYAHLLNNIRINFVHDRVAALNIGIGSKKEQIGFTSSLDSMNHVATRQDENTINVDCDTLDNILQKKVPALIKIDVEGFETEVLKGACQTLGDPELKAIIIELNGSGRRYGYDDENIHQTLTDFGFTPFQYLPETRTIVKLKTFGTHNTIYLRDEEFVKERLLSGETVKILNKEI